MKSKLNAKIGRGIAVALLAALGATGITRADAIHAPNDIGLSSPGFLSATGGGGKAASIDYSQYNSVHLGPLSATAWVEKAGAQGPLRDAAAERVAALHRDIEGRLGPVGGRNTP